MSEQQERVKVGDIVRLKTGGAEMTVVDDIHFVGNEPAAECSWQDNNHKPHSQVYPMKALVRVERDSTKH